MCVQPLSDGIGADIIFLSELIGGDVILEDLPHDGLLLGLGHRVGTDHGSDKGQLDKANIIGVREWQHGLTETSETPGELRRQEACEMLQRECGRQNIQGLSYLGAM